MLLSEYTGGNKGWGTLVSKCACCGEVVAEYRCDEEGVPVERIFFDANHECFEDEDDLNLEWALE